MTGPFKHCQLMIASVCLLAAIDAVCVWAGTLPGADAETFSTTARGKKDGGWRGPVRGWHYYLEDGYLGIDNYAENIAFRINGQIIGDAGRIDADDQLQTAFPGLDQNNWLFRKLHISVYANFYDTFDFRVGIDFANTRDIQDIWIRYLGHPFLKKIKVGNLKEPFSLEHLTSITRTTFMERALPEAAFSAGHNIGIRYDSQETQRKWNLGAGLFLNTGSFSDLGDAQNQISEANGVDATVRVFGTPAADGSGARILHLGLAYSFGLRDDRHASSAMEFRTRPESRLTDERLVDTGALAGKGLDKANAELALVWGSLSLQGQLHYVDVDADAYGDPQFWGYYTFLSYLLTGEHRKYNRALGIFSGIDPQPSFHPLKGEWGAWEVALRHSHVDLNGGDVRGGRESDATAGLNWIYNRNARLMVNYVYAHVTDRETPTVEDGITHIFQVRFQFIW
ncbi:MAG: OprO/OprP family phosphate-selective porin [Deltaproteobacteria bacterium]|nr:OprO/OprP family phosphate-selective porin [Deltaproteobacteria bacterium]